MATATENRPGVGQYTPVVDRADDQSGLTGHVHRQLIGYVGILLPTLLLLIDAVWYTDVPNRSNPLDSISAYYYTAAIAAFVGLLVALALFLFAYRGYRNEFQWADRTAAVIAGLAALGVAFFPTGVPAGFQAPLWAAGWMSRVHYTSAIVLFVMFAIFSLWLFRRTAPGQQAAPDKQMRNRIYLGCGILIVVGIAWAAYNKRNGDSIFLPESVALVAFAVSWLTKGYAHRSIKNQLARLRQT